MIFKNPDQDESDSLPETYVLELLAEPAKNSRHHLVFSDVKHTDIVR